MKVLASALVCLLAVPVAAQVKKIKPEDAKKHRNKTVEVCGRVYNAAFGKKEGRLDYINTKGDTTWAVGEAILRLSHRSDLAGAYICTTGRVYTNREGIGIDTNDVTVVAVKGAVVPDEQPKPKGRSWAEAFAAGAAAAAAAPNPYAPRQPELLLFGGENHRVFLGCLTCSEYDAGSVKNKYGTHGNKYSGESLFNQYSEYGSRYSNTSACNPYAQNPPAIVDRDGGFYGELTLNKYRTSRTKATGWLLWLEGVCQTH